MSCNNLSHPVGQIKFTIPGIDGNDAVKVFNSNITYAKSAKSVEGFIIIIEFSSVYKACNRVDMAGGSASEDMVADDGVGVFHFFLLEIKVLEALAILASRASIFLNSLKRKLTLRCKIVRERLTRVALDIGFFFLGDAFILLYFVQPLQGWIVVLFIIHRLCRWLLIFFPFGESGRIIYLWLLQVRLILSRPGINCLIDTG